MGENNKISVEDKLKQAKERRAKLKQKSKDLESGSSGTGRGAEEQQQVELPPPPGRPDAVPLGHTPRFRIDDLGENKGVEESASGMAHYRTGPEGSGVGILLIADLWGWNGGRTRAVADFLGAMLNAIVVVPKLLDSPPMDGGTHGDGLPAGFDLEGKPDALRSWLLKHSWDVLEPKVRAALVRLRNAGAKKIAGVGFGFGAWALGLASEKATGEYICGALLHPTVHTLQELHTKIHDDTEQDRLRKLRQVLDKMPGPHLLLTAAGGPEQYLPGGEVFEALAARPHGADLMPGEDPPLMAESLPFPNMAANWLDRGDLADPAVRTDAVEAVHVVERYLRRRLWPLERGADAARLRLLAKEGGEEGTMLTLLKYGVPAGGKDSADRHGLEPIHYAARASNIVEVGLLVEWQADINSNGGAGGETPLHLALVKGQQKFLSQLLKLRAHPEVRDNAGQSPLHHAARMGMSRLCHILISGKAKIAAQDTAEQTPLHLAAWNGKAAVVRQLLEAKMNVEPRDLRVQSPADRAEQQGWGAIAILLNEEKANRDEVTDSRASIADAMPTF